jgi:hypothetical protein
MKILLLVLTLLAAVPASAAELDCLTWNVYPQSAKIFYVTGYRDGIAMAVRIAPMALGKPEVAEKSYAEIHDALFGGESVGELVNRISIFCESNRTKNVISTLLDFAVETAEKKFKTTAPK